ncbi:hypothetical protein SEA_NICEHOUSE_113 [Rhodococcus phage NiceHouse]|nr:hypothetical protein SEA_NICEHOUSE_113 [Rhodococcus phage NiceHouse]
MKYKVGIGDWSQDGHGICDRYVVESDGDFDPAEIGKAYRASREELGLGIEDIANEYDSWPTEEQAQVFVDAGIEWPEGWYEPETDSRETLADALVNNWFDDVWIHIFVFMVKRNLPGFNLKVVNDNLPTLFGDSGAAATGQEFVGYGTKTLC